MNLPSTIFVLVAAFGVTALPAHADQRLFVWTYEYQTLAPGEAEVEYYHTLTTPYSDSTKGVTTLTQQVELEIGMTDRFDFSLYQVFKQSPGASLKFDASKFRSRYRFGDLGGDRFRPILYVEYQTKQDFAEHKVEFKPIAGQRGDPWNLAFQPVFEWIKKDRGLWLGGYSAAAGYRVGKLFNVGLEASGGPKGHYLGPTIAHGEGHLWTSLGAGFAVSEVDKGEPKLRIRLLIGIGVAGHEEH
ncbi:MAG: hypothetical protein FJY67_05355 [Calditrichaeota bacterium]|nr:hypothetical protein [Calditrichota bacterium]